MHSERLAIGSLSQRDIARVADLLLRGFDRQDIQARMVAPGDSADASGPYAATTCMLVDGPSRDGTIKRVLGYRCVTAGEQGTARAHRRATGNARRRPNAPGSATRRPDALAWKLKAQWRMDRTASLDASSEPGFGDEREIVVRDLCSTGSRMSAQIR